MYIADQSILTFLPVNRFVAIIYQRCVVDKEVMQSY